MTTARPILFSAPMVRALLEGRKTQTRRKVKHVPEAPGMYEVVHANPKHAAPYLDTYCGGRRTPENPRGMTQWWCWWTRDDRPCEQFKIPYGAPGDLLWVRESWQLTHVGGGRGGGVDPFNSYEQSYMADGHREYFTFEGEDDPFLRFASDKPRPSMFMPRWASRLTLEITGVRVQRLQDISEADAIAEGCGPVIPDELKQHPLAKHVGPNPRNHYAALWESLHGETGPGAWDANPWVVALTFTVHKQNVDAVLSERAAKMPGGRSMSEATLREALEEVETTMRKNVHLFEAGRLKSDTLAFKNRRLQRAHKVLMFFIQNEGWILDIYRARERMNREAELLCATDPDVREVLEVFHDAEITDVRPLSQPEPPTP